MKEMTVQELIDLLCSVKDKSKPIRMSLREYDWDGYPEKVEECEYDNVVYIKEN